ncbi:fumarylacetoacetate hydrolase family protein [Cupriavidus sp. WS]|uniref:fumarylacetoacetate hydrolase family protein n=1 Tax=Cupriavidus sp. WS TaxID=1312922 RepID=UPI0003623EEC|nr:fumarylacetoacetate hydrolase family protein [Cupriavidus sp. WS]
MKLVRYGAPGQELPGIIDEAGVLRSLSPLVADITAAIIAPAGQRMLRALDLSRLPAVAGSPRLGVPVAGIRQIVAVGLNYRQHAEEAKMAIPAEPMLFSKAISSLSGPGDDILVRAGSQKTDWEVELGIVIGTEAECVSEADALSHVAGYCNVNDVSERAWQLEKGGQFFKGKSARSFCPVGPWLATADEIRRPQELALSLSVNGKVMQTGNTADMIFGVPQLVSYISHYMTLMPGDLIISGTPAGVGLGMVPPQFLRAGDTVTHSITGLGEQHHNVVLY